MKLYIVNGFPRAGKDTLMDQFIECYISDGNVAKKHSTVDTVKNIAKILGWDGEKTPEARCMLSEFKDWWTKHFDGPLNEIKDIVARNKVDVLFTAMREPEEIEKTVKWANDNDVWIYTILVRGWKEEIVHTSHSDMKVLDYKYNLYMNNNGTVDAFKETCKEVYDLIEG